jgi:putative transposase
MRRRKQIRLQGYDYSTPGGYFVTICTRDYRRVFGEIIDGRMRLGNMGEIAVRCWKDLPKHFGDIELDEFIVMPNHIHGIIIIHDNPRRDVQLNIPTGNYHSRISPQRGSLGVIIRTYKAAVTTNCRQQGCRDFKWQSRFYDHIIRNEQSLNRVREYISTNAERWPFDKENLLFEGQDSFDHWLNSGRSQ